MDDNLSKFIQSYSISWEQYLGQLRLELGIFRLFRIQQVNFLHTEKWFLRSIFIKLSWCTQFRNENYVKFSVLFQNFIKFRANLYQNNLLKIKLLSNSILTINEIYFKFIFACENGEFCRHRKNNDRISRLNRLSSKVFITCHKWLDQRLFAFLYLF